MYAIAISKLDPPAQVNLIFSRRRSTEGSANHSNQKGKREKHGKAG